MTCLVMSSFPFLRYQELDRAQFFIVDDTLLFICKLLGAEKPGSHGASKLGRESHRNEGVHSFRAYCSQFLLVQMPPQTSCFELKDLIKQCTPSSTSGCLESGAPLALSLVYNRVDTCEQWVNLSQSCPRFWKILVHRLIYSLLLQGIT